MYLKLGSRHFKLRSLYITSHFLIIWVKYIAFPYGFLLKYRCVPKTGFSADISIDIFIDMSIGILTDKEEGGGRKEGRKEGRSGLLLKI